MDFIEDDLPPELQSPPEKRLVGTFITEKPNTKSLMVSGFFIALVIAVSQFYWLDPLGWAEFMPAMKSKIYENGEWWRVFTATLIHADLGHLLSNLYMLSIFSFFIYGYFGLWAYPTLTFLGAGLVNAIAINSYPSHVSLLGASGLVYLLGGFWLALYLFIQKQYRFSIRLIRVVGMALLVFFPTTFEPRTSYRTHFIGFVVGLALGVGFYLFNKRKIRKKDQYRIIH